jgi:hypothetical protein
MSHNRAVIGTSREFKAGLFKEPPALAGKNLHDPATMFVKQDSFMEISP